MKLSFLGAARSVTGSKYLAEADGTGILVDCGMFQERELAERNWAPFPFDPRSLAAVLLTHAHLDHCGLLPRLVREGFRGRIHCTAATAEIAQIVMEDSGRIQEEDAKHKQHRHARAGRKGRHPEVPLYTEEDAKRVAPRFSPLTTGTPVEVAPETTARFSTAGHILGATSILLRTGGGPRVLFSGDLGRWGRPILRDPDPPPEADIVITESTYGDRLHPETHGLEERLSEISAATFKAGGNVVIPSFAVERSQEVLYFLDRMETTGSLAGCRVVLDSPSAISVSEVFKRHTAEMDEETRAMIGGGHSPFEPPGLALARSPEESKAVNDVRKAVIIAGAGMCTGGRIKHHLVHNLPRPESTILFVGFQSVGTLGRQIADGAKEVRIFGEMVPVRARIERLEGFSGHGDREELFRWISALPRDPSRVFVTHGEPETAEAYARTLRERKRWPAEVPAYGERVELGR